MSSWWSRWRPPAPRYRRDPRSRISAVPAPGPEGRPTKGDTKTASAVITSIMPQQQQQQRVQCCAHQSQVDRRALQRSASMLFFSKLSPAAQTLPASPLYSVSRTSPLHESITQRERERGWVQNCPAVAILNLTFPPKFKSAHFFHPLATRSFLDRVHYCTNLADLPVHRTGDAVGQVHRPPEQLDVPLLHWRLRRREEARGANRRVRFP